MTKRRVLIRFVMALLLAGVVAGARTGMNAFASAGAGFPTLPNLNHGEGDTVSIAVAVANQPAGVTYSAVGLPAGLHIDNENFTDATGAHARGVIRGTLRVGAGGTDPATNAGSYTGDEGVYTVTIRSAGADTSVSNAFTWDIGRWGSGDVFVGGGTYTYQVYSQDSTFKYDVRVGDPATTQGFTTGCAANWHTGEVWATNFENNVNVITRHANNATTPYADASRSVSTLRMAPGGIYPIDVNVESIMFDNAQNMYVGHSFGWANNNGDPSDAAGSAIWLDDRFTLPARFNTATGYYFDWNRYKTTRSPTPGVMYDDGGNPLPGSFVYPVVAAALWNEAVAAWPSAGDWNVHKFEGAGLVTVDVNGQPILSAGSQYIGFDQPVSPDGFYEKWTGNIATYLLTALGAKIPIREQYGLDMHKYPSNPSGYGRDAAHFPAAYSNIRYGFTGMDTLDLMSDQKTVLYTSENQYLYRYDLNTNTQLPVVGSTVLASGASLTDVSHPIWSEPLYGIRLLPPGDGTGGYLVNSEAKVLRLDRNGNVIQTYDVTTDPDYPDSNSEGWFALAVAPDGRSFWAATRQDVFHFDIASGKLIGNKIHATDGIVHTASVIDGMCVVNEYRAAREICGPNGTGNGIDDDGDGIIDNGCFKLEVCSINSPGDDDGNGLADYNDPACYAPGAQPPSTMCSTTGPTDPSVAGFCARQNAEGEAVSVASIPPPCTGAACSAWTFNYIAAGLPPGLSINAATGAVTGSPLYTIVANSATAPPAVFPVTVTGTWTQTGQAPTVFNSTFNWTIVNTNRPPVAVNDTARVQSGVATLIDVMANDSDPDSTDVKSIQSASLTTPMDAGLHPTGTVTTDGLKVTYNAPVGFSGVVTFFYQLQDNYATPGVSNQAKVTLTVNGAPVANNDSYVMAGGTSLTVNAANGVIQNLAGKDTDPEGTALTVFSSTAPSHGAVVLNADGSFTYTPVPGYTGTDTFTYVVTDGEARSNTATVTILVPVPPIANNDTYSTQKNVALNVTTLFNGILGNDTDPQNGTLRVSTFTQPAHGVVVMTPTNDGTFVYTPTLNYVGADSFTYVATNGSYTSNTATVSITVVTANNPPVAVNDSYSVNNGSTLTVAAGDILRNDSDPDHDIVTAALVAAPTQGGTFAFTPLTGAFVYTPPAGLIGDVTFTYKVSDPYGLASNTATVTIHVNNLPVANNDSYTTAEDTVLTVAASGILVNDTDIDPGSTRTVVLPLVTQPSHGTVVQQANGSFVYTPARDYNGTDSYTYRVVDDRGALSNVATVNITITPVNDPPIAVADAYSTLQGQPLVVAAAQGFIQRNDSDVDDATNTLVAVMVSTVGHGSLIFGTDGSFTYTPTTGFSGTDTFSYFVRDPGGLTSNTVTVTITVIATDATVTTSPVCSNNAAWVDYTLAPVNYTWPAGTTAQIDWVDSANRIVRTDSGAALSGRAVWPGTVIVLGLPIDWPGWILSGVLWIPGVDGFELTVPTVKMRFTVGGKTKEVAVNYPSTGSGCAAAPPSNQPPVANNDYYSTNQNTALTVGGPGILTNDRDPEGGALTVNLPLNALPQHGTLTQNTDGSFVYTPATNWSGVDSYSYRAKDVGGLLSNLTTVNITVIGSTVATMPDVTATYDGLQHPTVCTVRGADGASLLGGVTYVPALSTHVGTYAAACNFPGDGDHASASATATVRVNPAALTITATNLTKAYGTAATLGTTAFTTAGLASGDSVTAATLTSTGAAATALPSATPYAIAPSAALGTNLSDYTITYVNGALTVTKPTLTITASNRAKNYGTVATFAGTEFTASGLVLTDTVTSATLTSTGAPASAAGGSYLIVPSAAVGTGLANYTIVYVNGALTINKLVVTITASSASVTYGASVPTITPSYSGFINGDTSAVLTTQPTCTTTYTTTSTAGSTPSTSCANAAAASYSFSYVPGTVTIAKKAATVTAGGGTKVFGAADPALSATTSTNISAADLTGITLTSTRTAGENVGSYTTTATAAGGNIANYTVSYAAGAFTITKATPVATATGGTYTYDGTAKPGTCAVVGANGAALTGTITYSNGSAPVNAGTYTVSCAFAGDANYNAAATATATITITDPNHPPVAANDTYTATKSTSLNISSPGVKTNDSDPDGDAITSELVSSPSHGTVTLRTDGSFTYVPTTNYTGTDTFTYKVKDSKGAYSNVATVTINITAVACNLVAKDDDFTTNKNHAIVIGAPGVLKNDQDPYQRGLTVSEVNGQAANVGRTISTSHGTVKVNADGSFTYTPAYNYTSTDTFTYKAKSSYNGTVSNLATVIVSSNYHYDGDGCDHDRHRNNHYDGDGCSHDRELAHHYDDDNCDHDRGAKGHHSGDGCAHDRDTHRHFYGDWCDHERRRNGHYSGDGCTHDSSVSSHYDGDGCDHDRDRNGHTDGDHCSHDVATGHHNEGDGCDHDTSSNGHYDGDKCAHDRDDHGHNDGDGCDHDRHQNGHYDGDRCEHDDHANHDADDDNACIVTTGEGHEHHPGTGHDDEHHSGDYCDHDRGRKGHYSGDGCEHDKVSKHSYGDGCDHDRRRNGHYTGDGCDHDRSQRNSRDRNWSW